MNKEIKVNKREHFPHYIGINASDEKLMLQELGLSSTHDLFKHIPDHVKHDGMKMPKGLSAAQIKTKVSETAKKNKIVKSFIGDGLQQFKVSDAVSRVSSIRGLTTAYTPYQPERSQGTLQTLWIYQNLISKMTGFEAINASLYERATCLYEALTCATRIKKNHNTVLVADNIYPGDKKVLLTQAKETFLDIVFVKIDPNTGLVDHDELAKLLSDEDLKIAAVAISQISTFGQIEDVDRLTDLIHAKDALVISLVNIHTMANQGLKQPTKWGEKGADILVAEGQALTIAPNYGGPGLGIFGIRYNQDNKTFIRSTAGRYIGKTKDENGRECKAIILSTREQHIRREKATSNICSNQSFIASACGAALLNKGSEGLKKAYQTAHKNAYRLVQDLTSFEGVDLLFDGPIFNEFTLKIDRDIDDLIRLASEEELHIGVNISGRCGLDKNLLKISLSDQQSNYDIQCLINFFKSQFKPKSISATIHQIPQDLKRKDTYKFKSFSEDEVYEYYLRLGEQNLSPDDGLYPLGSCTMKYNPELNEWAAGLEEFQQTHPQAPTYDVQGNLEVLYEIQELFKDITGLPGVTTQPVAGAQGELVGLKLFQAYHRSRGEQETRNVILIPRSAHGTNPATATMAGYETKLVNGQKMGIITIEAAACGQIDFEKFEALVHLYKNQIAGIMVTNPNTAGIFESRFADMSKLIHEVGGLVYMDGANMNAVAGIVDLHKLGVDAVHNNLHKTWSIPHGGGGPGDAIVAVSEKLIDFLPGYQVKKNGSEYTLEKPRHSIGSFHRHHGNFAHKVRAYTYLLALGSDGIVKMSTAAVLSARYLHHKLGKFYPTLPKGAVDVPRMHEFIITLSEETFDRIAKAGTPKAQAISRIGKLFLDFGFHAPTVAFPEVFGLMIEPTESFTKAELDSFAQVVETIFHLINEHPQILRTVPHFTPIDRVNEVLANKEPTLFQNIENELDPILEDRIPAAKLRNMEQKEIIELILHAHEQQDQ